VAILSIYQGKDLHPLAFHSRSFQLAERNYNVHDKELLAIFEAFKRWWHYLEGTSLPVDVFTDHHNLEYFCESKTLTCRQACWSEFLSQFNLKIHFRLGKLGMKPDALTRKWDVYHKGEPGTKGTTNSQNICPLFLPEQLSPVLRASHVPKPQPLQDFTLDLGGLTWDIKNATLLEPLTAKLLAMLPSNLSPPWSKDTGGWLLFQDRLYIPNITDLHLWTLCTFHDHALVDHPGQTKTQQLIQCEFAWPKLRTSVVDFVHSCPPTIPSTLER